MSGRDVPTAPHEVIDAGDGPLRYGLVIEFPEPRVSSPLPFVFAEVALHEVDAAGNERLLPGVTGMTLRLSPADCMTADVESLVTVDGEPLYGEPGQFPRLDALAKDENGEEVRAVFRYVVAAARVTDVWARGRSKT